MTDEPTALDPLAESPDPLGETTTEVREPTEGEELPPGYNPSEGEAPPEEPATEGQLPAEPEQVETAVEESEVTETPSEPEPEPTVPEPEPEPEPEPVVVEDPEPEPEVPAPEPDPEPEPATAPTNGTSRKRNYLVFQKHAGVKATGNKPYFTEDGAVLARNGDNALRAAYRTLAEDEDGWPDTTLVVVAERMWQPKRIKTRERNAPPAIEIG